MLEQNRSIKKISVISAIYIYKLANTLPNGLVIYIYIYVCVCVCVCVYMSI